MQKVILLEVDAVTGGNWDPDTEVVIGEFETTDQAIAFARESLLGEGWGEIEISQMPLPGTPGSRFQFRLN